MNVHDFYSLYQKAGKVTIDSRNIEKGDLFFAFSGENFNAATLAEKAVDDGALAVIVEQKEYENPSRNIFYVPSTLEFLQELARKHRRHLSIPVIGLTGSNGKTTTKELISAVLAKKFRVQNTKGNLNNHIGVPLTVLSIRKDHQIAVVEMGANHQKEIAFLCTISQPDYGYITNFGKAHLEGFGGVEGVIRGKSELYEYLMRNDKTVIVNENDPIQREKTADYPKKISFGTSYSDYFFEKLSEEHHVGLYYNHIRAFTQLTGDYNFTNLCAAASLGLYFGISFSQISDAFAEYTPTNMRSQMVEKNGKMLVLDTYNANPSSMAASLTNFSGFEGSKTAILGDMLELGEESRKEHENILEMAHRQGFDQVITVGKNFMEINPENAFADTQELSDYLKKFPVTAKNILVKGSRGIALEKIINDL